MVTLIQYQVYMLAGTARQLAFDPVKSQVYRSIANSNNDPRMTYTDPRLTYGFQHATAADYMTLIKYK